MRLLSGKDFTLRQNEGYWNSLARLWHLLPKGQEREMLLAGMNFTTVKTGSSPCSCPLENPKGSQLFTQFLAMAAIHKPANPSPALEEHEREGKAGLGRHRVRAQATVQGPLKRMAALPQRSSLTLLPSLLSQAATLLGSNQIWARLVLGRGRDQLHSDQAQAPKPESGMQYCSCTAPAHFRRAHTRELSRRWC